MPLPESPSTDCEVASRPDDAKEASSASPGKRRLLLDSSSNSSVSSSRLGLPKLSADDGNASGESDTMLLADSRPVWARKTNAYGSSGQPHSGMSGGVATTSTGGSASSSARGTPQPCAGVSSAAALGSGRFAGSGVSGTTAATNAGSCARGTPQSCAQASSAAALGSGRFASAGVSGTTAATNAGSCASDGISGTPQLHAEDDDGAIVEGTGAHASGEVNLAAAAGPGLRQGENCSEIDKQRLMSLVTDTGLEICDGEAEYICGTVNSRTAYKVTEHPAMSGLVMALHTLSESPEELLRDAYDNGDYAVLEYLACSEAGARHLLLEGCVANVKDLCSKLKDIARPEREQVGLMDLARLCRSLADFIKNKDVWHLCEILSEFSMSQLQPPRRLMDTAVRLIRDRLAGGFRKVRSGP